MAQSVLPVEGVAYSANAFDDLFEVLGVKGSAATQGVFRTAPGVNALAVTGTATPVAVASGWALVKGKLYKNSASVDIAVASPATDPRIDRVVLRTDYTASPVTCVLALLAGTPDPSPTAPALTQTDGTTWEISLAQVHITSAGVITVTDERAYVGDGHVATASLAADAVTGAKIADDAIDSEHYVDASIDTAHIGLLQVTTALLAADCVTGAKIPDDAIDSEHYAHGSIDTAHIANDQITAALLAHDVDASAIGFNAAKVGGYTAAELMGGGVILGAIVLWYGTLGGTGTHCPVVSGLANEDWHICNGDTVNGLVTPDLRDKFVVGVGTTYAKAATGGAATANLTHNHSATGLSVPSGGAHTNQLTDFTLNAASGSAVWANTGASMTSETDGAHTHSSLNGTTANQTGQTAVSIMPPYLGVYYIMKVA